MADEAVAFQQLRTFEAKLVAEHARDPEGKAGMQLLLSCMDYRYPRRIVDAMHRFRPGIPYDQFVLAGASLGACNPDWQRVLVEHVKAALKLGHVIKEIVILDHRDCGAYKHPREISVPEEILLEGLPDDVLPSKEMACHQHVLSNAVPMLRRSLQNDIPDLKFSAWLLTRDEDDPLVVV